MAQTTYLETDLQAFRDKVTKFIQDVRTDYRSRILNTWMEPTAGGIEITNSTIFNGASEAINNFLWVSMDELEAMYDKGGSSCACKAIYAAAMEILGDCVAMFNKDKEGLCPKGVEYYVLPADSTLSDSAKLDIKAVRDEIETVLHCYRTNLRNVVLHKLDTVKQNMDVVRSLQGSLDVVLQEVFREAVTMWQAHKEHEFFYLLASTIKQVRDHHLQEKMTMMRNTVVERETEAYAAKLRQEVEGRAHGAGEEAEGKTSDAGGEDEVMAEPVGDVKE